jgi:hypothetical protein
MYKVYHGGKGRPRYVEEPREDGARASFPPPPRPAPPTSDGSAEPIRRAVESLLGRLTGELETEDLILLLILYLMYRESGDTEMLFILGAMILL